VGLVVDRLGREVDVLADEDFGDDPPLRRQPPLSDP
jgi:hypothetical protein